MKGRFTRVREGVIDIRAVLDEELAKTPVTVEASTIEVKIFPQCSQRFTIGEEELDGAHVTVIHTMADQGYSINCCGCGIATCDIIEDEVSTAISNSIQHQNRLHESTYCRNSVAWPWGTGQNCGCPSRPTSDRIHK